MEAQQIVDNINPLEDELWKRWDGDVFFSVTAFEIFVAQISTVDWE